MPVSLNHVQINAIVFRNEVLPEFGFYYAQTLKRWLHGQSSATTIPIVNKRKFQQAPFPLAPLEDQHRIVAEIEMQFSRLDEAVAGLRRVKANLKRYKAAVLKAAVEGRLVANGSRTRRSTMAADYESGVRAPAAHSQRRQRQRQGEGQVPRSRSRPTSPNCPQRYQMDGQWASIDQLAKSAVTGRSL